MFSLVKSCCDIVRALPAFQERESEAVVFVEDRFNPEALIAEYSNTRLRVMFAASSHQRKTGTGAKTFGDYQIEAVVIENPMLRARDGTDFSLSDAAAAIVGALHWQTVDGARLVYQRMAREDYSQTEYRLRVTFAAYRAIDGEKVVWGVDGDLATGIVTSATFARGGVNVFEPDRNGDSRFLGTRDKHWTVALTATSAITAPDSLPAFGEPFTYGGKTYYTTAASLALSGEDTATVSLAGRTMPQNGQQQPTASDSNRN